MCSSGSRVEALGCATGRHWRVICGAGRDVCDDGGLLNDDKVVKKKMEEGVMELNQQEARSNKTL